MPTKKEKEAMKRLKKEEKKRQKLEEKMRKSGKLPPQKTEVRHVVGQMPPTPLEQVQLRNPRPNSLPLAPGPRPDSMNSQRSLESSRSQESQLRTPTGSIPPHGYPHGRAGQSPQGYPGYGSPANNPQGLQVQSQWQYQQGMNAQPPQQYQQGANGPHQPQYQQGVNGQMPLQYQQGVNGHPPSQYQQGVNGQHPSQYQQRASKQSLSQYQQGVGGHFQPQYQQGVNGQNPVQYRQGVSGQNPQHQQGVNVQPPQQYPQGFTEQPQRHYPQGPSQQNQKGPTGPPAQNHPGANGQQFWNYGQMVNKGPHDSYFLPEADYDDGGLQYKRERFRPPSTPSGRADSPNPAVPQARRSSGSYPGGRPYGSPNTLSEVFSTQLNSELRHKIEEKRQEIPEDDGWQFGTGKDPIDPDIKTHQTMIHARQVANILNQEISQRKPYDHQQVAYRDPNIY